MLRRIEGERPSETLASGLAQIEGERAVPAIAGHDDAFDATFLPRDHPPWNKDTLTISQRARELIGRLRPIAIRVLSFWDHRIRTVSIGHARLSIDASGSYRKA